VIGGDRIAIDSGVIDAHAARVEQVAGDVRVAVQAAGQTMLSASAFGLMCSWMIPPFLATAGAATATMVSAASALDRSAREIRAVAADFDALERQVGEKLGAERSGLDAV
jgi:hypothetical protein